MKIHVIMGSTGEYSDRREWPVRAVRDEERAKCIVELATQRATVINESKDRYASLDEKNPAHVNEWDPDMQTDYTGTSYFYYTVDLDD